MLVITNYETKHFWFKKIISELKGQQQNQSSCTTQLKYLSNIYVFMTKHVQFIKNINLLEYLKNVLWKENYVVKLAENNRISV